MRRELPYQIDFHPELIPLHLTKKENKGNNKVHIYEYPSEVPSL